MSAPIAWHPLLKLAVLPIFLVVFIVVGIPFGIVYWTNRALKKWGITR